MLFELIVSSYFKSNGYKLDFNSLTDVAGSTDIILMGKKKPQAFAPGPPGQGGVNTDGTWNIKG